MANSILKLRIDDQEYNAKLKNAVQGLQHLNEVAHRGAGEMTGLEKSEVEFIKALGDMETKSRSAAGRARELESAFKELKVIYDNLNEVEKADEGGKALVKSLDTLKQRAQEARQQINEATEALKNSTEAEKESGSVLDQLSEKFTINFDAVKLFNTALKAADGAMQVAKDAFFASEATVDEWGRTVESSRSLYEGFLTALNNSDISGYLSRMDQIVAAARKAYDELDRLGTMKTIQGPAMSAQQAENDRMRQMIMTGRYIAPVDGRNAAPGMVNGQRLTAEQIRAIERNLQGGMQKIVTLVGNEVKQTSKAIDARYSLMAKENGMTLKEFRQGTSSMAEFDKRIRAAAEYEKYERAHTTTITRVNPTSGDPETVMLRDNTKNPYEAYKNWGTFRVDKMGQGSYNDLVNLIRQRDQQAAQAYGMQSQAYRSINRAEGTTVRDIMNGKTGGNGGGTGGSTSGKTTVKDVYVPAEGSIDAQVEKVRELTKQWSAATDQAGRDGYKKQLDEAQGILDQMRGKAKAVTQEMATGISGLTPDMIKWGENDIKQQMQSVEYGTQEYNDLAQRLIDYNSVSNLMQEAVKTGLEVDDSVKEYFVNALTGPLGENIPQALYDSLVESLNEFKEYTGDNPIELNTTTGNVQEVSDKKKKGDDDALKETQKVVSGLSQVASGLQAMGIMLPSEVTKVLSMLQGAMTVVQGVTTIVSVFGSTSMTANSAALGANTGAMIANTAAMVSLEAALYANTAASWIPFAEGGVVPKFAEGGVIPRLIGKAADGMLIPGNSYSGDRLRMPVDGGRGMIGVNSGELILNMSSQDNLAAMIKSAESLVGTIRDESMTLSISQANSLADALDNEGGAISSTPYVTGEQIYLGLNNYLKGAGLGSLVTSQG